jgi:hypothetical protein
MRVARDYIRELRPRGKRQIKTEEEGNRKTQLTLRRTNLASILMQENIYIKSMLRKNHGKHT